MEPQVFPPLSARTINGKEDSVVPVTGSHLFVEAVRKSHPNVLVKLVHIQLGDYGFDEEATLDSAWLEEDVEFVTRYWLQ